jgi:hypothetical protein
LRNAFGKIGGTKAVKSNDGTVGQRAMDGWALPWVLCDAIAADGRTPRTCVDKRAGRGGIRISGILEVSDRSPCVVGGKRRAWKGTRFLGRFGEWHVPVLF